MKIGIIGGSGFYGSLALFDGKFSETENCIVREIEKRELGKFTFLGKIIWKLGGLAYTREHLRRENRALVPLIQEGKIGDNGVVFISRHGREHFRLAHEVAYQAEIALLREKGVEAIITTAAVGGINEKYAVGDFVVLDGGGELAQTRKNFITPAHFGVNPLYSTKIRNALLDAGRELGCRIHDGGSYALKQGPEFETAKEIDDLRRLGYDVVGMTTLTEAK
ncbi:MAG: hypothetical protein V1820_05060, partial [archaeon]